MTVIYITQKKYILDSSSFDIYKQSIGLLYILKFRRSERFVVAMLVPRKVAFYMGYRGAPLAYMRRSLTGYVS